MFASDFFPRFAEPSELKKMNDQALKDADPEVKKDLAAADKEADQAAGGDGDAEYTPTQNTDDGKAVPEGTELEPVDDEVV